MKKIELNDKIETNLPIDEINKRIMNFCNQNQIKIKEMNQKRIIGMCGSRFSAQTRGMLADPSILPVKIIISLKNNGNAVWLSVLMKKGWIGYPPFGISKKYSIIFAQLMNKLKLEFYRKMYLKEDISECSNCGKEIYYENQRFCESCGYELSKIS